MYEVATKNSNEKLQKRIAFILGVMIYSGSYLLSVNAYGSIVLFVLIFAFSINYILMHHFKFTVYMDCFLVMIFVFALYSFLSSVWSNTPQDAINKGTTIFEILIMIILLYPYYCKEASYGELLGTIKWGGYIVILGVIGYYGIDTILSIMRNANTRLDSTILNSNTLGIVAAYSVLIEYHYFLSRKVKMSSIMVIPCVILVACSGSRKALLALGLGLTLVWIIHNSKKGIVTRILKIITALLFLVIIIYFLRQSDLFEYSFTRVEYLINHLKGSGKIDNSAYLRSRMNQLGLELFVDNPILGIGIGNTHIYAANRIGMDAYLHNNYIELLAGGGILGFGIYYSIYVNIFSKFINIINKREAGIFAVIVFLNIILDYGMVSYYTKGNYLLLMVCLAYLKSEKGSNKRECIVDNQ